MNRHSTIIKNMLIVFVIVHLLAGCSRSIDAKQAEEIAIQTAIEEGYTNPRLYTEFNIKTKQTYHFSVEKNKDIRTWRVTLITDEREYQEYMGVGDLIYFIDIENGDIVEKISGIDTPQ